MHVTHDRAKEIFLQATEIASPEERSALLDRECGGDDALRREIEELLRHERSLGSFLEHPAIVVGDNTVDHEPSVLERPGEMIGPYKLLEQIGEGGFGVVFMAEQERPVRRRVAMKVIKPGMDTRQVIARFEAERQALAMMDHANIAKVLDAGATETGRPYFVMELVQGVPITTYCDQCNLSIRERLTLFVTACQAVQHAHQKGIIHRDIKPTNVLVTIQDSLPSPKIIDFGVAKAIGERLTDHTLITGFNQLIGTPLYMSPEQAELSPLGADTRSDIYSLGVLLYELLTGTTPFDSNRLRAVAHSEMLRIIREEEPQSPSMRISTLAAKQATTLAQSRRAGVHQLNQQLRGELDWIVMKTLEKDRNRRYDSANDLARDILRYLRDEPVRACPPSVTYRVGKFVRRNRHIIASLTAISLAVSIATIVIAINTAVTREQSRAAKLLRNEQQQTTNALKEAEKYRRQAERLSAVAALDRGLQACNEGELARGLLWITRSLNLVPKDDAEFQRAIRVNVAAWSTQLSYRLEMLRSHDGWVHSVAFSPDGRYLVSGGIDKVAKVWEVSSGRLVYPPLPHNGLIYQIAFSPDGSIFATACDDGSVRLWETVTGRLVRDSWTHDDMVYALAFNPDGSRLTSGGRDGTIRVWNVATGDTALEPIHINEVNIRFVLSLAYSPDGSEIISSSNDNYVRIWDSSTGELLRRSHSNWGTNPVVTLSPDGKNLAIGVTENTVYITDYLTWEVRFRLAHRGNVNSIAFTNDSEKLLTASADGNVRVWRIDNGKLDSAAIQHSSAVYSVAASQNDKHVATATSSGLVRLWRREHDTSTITLPHDDDVRSIATSGQKLLVGTLSANVHLWDLLSHLPLATLSLDNKLGAIYAVDFHPNGKRFLVAWGRRLQVFDTEKQLPVTPFATYRAPILAAKFSPDGERILTGSSGRTAQMWDAATCETIGEPIEHPHWVHSVSFAPDGQWFMTGCEDCMARRWDIRTLEQIGPSLPHQGPVWGTDISPDGMTAVTGSWGDGVARIWDLASGTTKLTLFNDRGHVYDVAFSSDGQSVATAHWDRAAQLWDLRTGRPLGPPVLHDAGVPTVCFSADGQRLISGSHGDNVVVKSISSPATGSCAQITDWVSVLTGLELAADGTVVPISESAFHERRRSLQQNEFSSRIDM